MDKHDETGGKVVEAGAKWECYKCSGKFADERSLDRHITARAGSCIGVWYICKRCLDFFGTAGDLKRHQSLKRGCPKAVLGGKQLRTGAGIVPMEAVAAVRLRRGAEDAGGMDTYLERVVMRGDHQEVIDVLQACQLADIPALLAHVEAVSDDTGLFIDLIAVISDHSNTPDISPEKRALLRAFVDQNVRL